MILFAASAASAQSEEIEPRVVGAAGAMSLGVSGFVDRLMSSEDTFPLNVTLHVDVTRFLTERIAVRGGLIGTAAFADDDADEEPTALGGAALHAVACGFLYFTPRSLVSPYAGIEYRAQLTDRPESDAGTVLGKGGLEAAVSSRALVFLEGGYGARLTRGEDDELQTRIVAEVGFRIRF
jgi:hypothetical protein